MYKKILVPLDGSELAERAILYAKEMALKFGSEPILFTTLTPGDRMEHPLKEYMEKKAGELRVSGIKATLAYAQGDAATEIINFAENSGVSLTIISTHGCTGDRCWPMGSITNKVLQKSHAPVLLIRSTQPETASVEGELQKILVTLDGSHTAETIIPHIESFARKMGSEIVLSRAIEPIIIPHLASYRKREEYEQSLMDKIREEANYYLGKQETALRHKGINVSSALLEGEPTQAILQYAENNPVGLIAITTHGFSGITKWVYGSVASHIIESSSKTIFLVRPSMPAQ